MSRSKQFSTRSPLGRQAPRSRSPRGYVSLAGASGSANVPGSASASGSEGGLPAASVRAPAQSSKLKAHSSSGFSLVELLVVIGIISLLIGIAMPAFSQAKLAAKVAATNATINSIGTGMETLRADERLGGDYAPSYAVSIWSPHISGSKTDVPVTGASLAVYALAGADLLGSAGIRDRNGIVDTNLNRANIANLAPWADDLHALRDTPVTGVHGSHAIGADNRPLYSRTSFVDVTKMKFAKRDGNLFVVPANINPDAEELHAPVFLDSFDQPILYYRARAGTSYNVCDTRSYGLPADNAVYNFYDNAAFTGSVTGTVIGMNFGAGVEHFKSTDPSNKVGQVAAGEPPRGSFGYALHNPDVTARATPHNAETFILLSAGPDGLFGTEDDIANFPMNK